MTFYYQPSMTGWSIIIFLFSIEIILGTVGLYIGPKVRTIMKKENKPHIILMIDIFLVASIIYPAWTTIKYWFLEGNYDGTTLDNIWIILTTYGSIGTGFIFIYGFTFLWSRFLKERGYNNDADREV